MTVVDRLATYHTVAVTTPVGVFVYVDGVLTPVDAAPDDMFGSCPDCEA